MRRWRITRREFAEFLRRHEDDTFSPGDCDLCPMAVFGTEGSRTPGDHYRVNSDGPASYYASLYSEAGGIKDEYRLPAWAERFVEAFDEFGNSTGQDPSGKQCINILEAVND